MVSFDVFGVISQQGYKLRILLCVCSSYVTKMNECCATRLDNLVCYCGEGRGGGGINWIIWCVIVGREGGGR